MAEAPTDVPDVNPGIVEIYKRKVAALTETLEEPNTRLDASSDIRGDVRRGTGILNNELYVGVRVWNHKHSVKDPSTGKDVTRLNPESEWVRNAVPELRIVSDDLWAAVKHQQAALAERYAAVKEAAQARTLSAVRRPAYLLSGLLECGLCGGAYAIVVNDRYGCTGHHRGRSCANGWTIRREQIERRALAGIAERLVSADKIEAAVAAYTAHINRENREQRVQADADARALAKVERAIAGMQMPTPVRSRRSSVPLRASCPRSRMVYTSQA